MLTLILALGVLAALVITVPGAVILAACYILGPGFNYLMWKAAARPQLALIEVERMPERVRSYMVSCVRVLEEEGFGVAARLSLADAEPNAAAFLMMMHNRATREQAIATVLYTHDLAAHVRSGFVEFRTDFEHGQSVETTNSPALSPFAPGPKEIKIALPDERDAHNLLLLHRHVCRSLAPSRAVSTFDGEDAAHFAARLMAEEHEAQVKLGVLSFDRANDIYRPTWKGACLMCWGGLWPVAPIRRARARRAARRRARGMETSGAGGF